MCGPNFCPLKITEDVRRYAEEQGVSEKAALEAGLREKSAQFAASGDEIYH